MDLSSLPQYPNPPSPEPAPPQRPATACEGEPPPDRGRTMLLQLLFLVAFWGGLYVLRQQVTVISEATKAAEVKQADATKAAEAKKIIDGKWRSTQADGTILEIRDGRFWFSRNGKDVLDGECSLDGECLSLWIRTLSGIAGYWSLRYRATPDELVIWGNGDTPTPWIALVRKVAREEVSRVQEDGNVLHFKRVGQ